MKKPTKMKLSDLQPKTPDVVNWGILDEFYYHDCPNLLSRPLVLTNIIKAEKILEVESIDNGIVLRYLQGMTSDAMELRNRYDVMKQSYETNKLRYQGNYDEDAHMYSLQAAHEMHDWLESYENTIGGNIVELVDYINNLVVPEQKLNLQ